MSDPTDFRRRGRHTIEAESDFEVDALKHRIRELEDALIAAGDSPETQARKRAVALERANGELEAEIAERVRTEQALRRERDFNSAILETVGALVLVSDLEGRVVMFNRACEAATGYAAREVIGRCLWDTPLLGDQASAAERAFRTPVSDDFPNQAESYWVAKDGARHLIRWSNTCVLAADGSIGHVIGTGIDVTEQRRAESALRASEARLRAIIDQSPADIHLSDTDGRYILVNPQFERWYGISREAAEGKTPADLLPSDFAASSIAHCRAAAAAGRAIEKEHQAPFRDGFHTLLTVKFPVPGETAGAPTICTISTDITDLKQREAALLAAKQDAELANRAKSEFLANMSHELRTPLTAIIGFAELIRGETLGPLGDPGYRGHAGEIESAGRDLLGLINDVIELSRIEAGKLELYESEVDAEHAIRSSLILAGGRAHHSGMTLKQDLPENLPKLFADERTLKQMLLNLLSNAIKFTPSGGTVTVKARADPEEGYLFQVCDTGIGMSVTDIPKAMVHFGQVNGRYSREFGGTGLGLPLTKSLIELHGGSLDLESARGAGTTVTLRFPPERIVPKPTGERKPASAPPVKAPS